MARTRETPGTPGASGAPDAPGAPARVPDATSAVDATSTTPPPERRVEEAIHRSAQALLRAQRPDGSWPNRQDRAVSGTAAAVMALHLADPARSLRLIEDGIAFLLRHRNADGGWGNLTGTSSDAIATATVIATLRVAAPHSTARQVQGGLDWLRSRGGLEALSDPAVTQLAGLLLSIAGLHDAATVRRVPSEVLLLPALLRRRLMSYIMLPLSVLIVLQNSQRPAGPLARMANRLTERSAVRLMGQFEEQEGGTGALAGDPWLTALACTALVLRDTAPQLVRGAVDYLRSTVQPDGSWLMLHGTQVRQADVPGPASAAASLVEAGYGGDPGVARARQWFLDCRQDQPFPLFGIPSGGWSWAGAKGWPSVYDTLPVLGFLAATGDHQALREGADWLARRQDRRGSWSTWVRNAAMRMDGPCPYQTAEAIGILTAAGARVTDRWVRRGLRWLTRHQQPDGSYRSCWQRGGVPGTAAVLCTLSELGRGGSPTARRARTWLLSAQLPDGSWGEGPGAGAGTADETARAVRALVSCREFESADRGVAWLLDAQQPEGFWEPGHVCRYNGDVIYQDAVWTQGLALGALVARNKSAPPGSVRSEGAVSAGAVPDGAATGAAASDPAVSDPVAPGGPTADGGLSERTAPNGAVPDRPPANEAAPGRAATDGDTP